MTDILETAAESLWETQRNPRYPEWAKLDDDTKDWLRKQAQGVLSGLEGEGLRVVRLDPMEYGHCQYHGCGDYCNNSNGPDSPRPFIALYQVEEK